ncbi:hypothetical protein A2Y99_01285 [Candidatus Gottesmanbacteria bacterium RBG_13_37_7]|uniref:Glycosyltransferase n=1 Tax=Candidatus Gottesmanbacteria bacterium RBG_13_37_7 TaxID=1798369 RepID=A0A1F5YH24_9BACT|nr:MAG: hypothetical protein A2Y99_01285 [Candidatus Gottesmanbacteria bacterium RBG_13_37_7]
MKILNIVPYFYPAVSVGGTASVVHDISLELTKKGHLVTVYTSDLFGKNRRVNRPKNVKVDNNGIETYYFKNLSTNLAYYQHIFLPPVFFNTLTKTINSFDIIHLHEIYTLMNAWTYLLARKYKVPYLISSHGTAEYLTEAGRVGRKKIFNQLIGKRLFKNAAGVIAVAESEKNHYLNLGADESKISVIPNGVKLMNYSNLPEKIRARKSFNIDSTKTVLLYLGRIHRKKGLNVLVSAFAQLVRENNSLVLLVAGSLEDEDYYRKIMKQIQQFDLMENIIFTGEVTGKRKLSAFSAADLFVLPSYGEGLPVSALEAAACGLPLVISKKCNLPEVKKFNAGKIIAPEEESIYRNIKELIQNKKKLMILGRNAKEMVRKNYTIQQSAEKLEKLYRKIINTYG